MLCAAKLGPLRWWRSCGGVNRGEGFVGEARRADVVARQHRAEGAGAASLAAAFELSEERLSGRKVVGVLSGGNMAVNRYAEILGGMNSQ